jgi:hypothetical protein
VAFCSAGIRAPRSAVSIHIQGLQVLMRGHSVCRLALQAFLRLLDIPVDKCYGCPFGPCNQGEHGELTVTCDGTTVGYRKGSAKEYVPTDAAGAASVPDHMCVVHLVENSGSAMQCLHFRVYC